MAPDDGKRYCPKHVECYLKNKFEKLVHLIGFLVRIKKNSTFAGATVITQEICQTPTSIIRPRTILFPLTYELLPNVTLLKNSSYLRNFIAQNCIHWIRDSQKCGLRKKLAQLYSINQRNAHFLS